MEQLKTILEKDSFPISSDGTSHLVTFLPASTKLSIQVPFTIPKSTAQIIATSDSEVFSITHGGGEGALPNPFIESKLKAKTTTRNLNIIGQIVEKFGA
jgi:hypothetical protein